MGGTFARSPYDDVEMDEERPAEWIRDKFFERGREDGWRGNKVAEHGQERHKTLKESNMISTMENNIQ